MDIIGQFISLIIGLFVLLWLVSRVMVLPFRINPREWFRSASSGTTSIFEFAFIAIRAVLRFFFPETFGLGRSSARFLGGFERRKILNADNGGLVLDGDRGRLSANDSFRNCLVVATTGGGKTSSFIIPNILRLDRASIVITDPSGALYEKTSGDLRRRGFEVLALDPLRLDRSVRYNPLATADTQRAIGETSHILSRSANFSGDKFWTDGAEDIITILIRCLKRHPNQEYCNLANVQYLLNNFGDGSGIADFVAKHADEATYQQFKGFVSSAENTMQARTNETFRFDI